MRTNPMCVTVKREGWWQGHVSCQYITTTSYTGGRWMDGGRTIKTSGRYCRQFEVRLLFKGAAARRGRVGNLM